MSPKIHSLFFFNSYDTTLQQPFSIMAKLLPPFQCHLPRLLPREFTTEHAFHDSRSHPQPTHRTTDLPRTPPSMLCKNINSTTVSFLVNTKTWNNLFQILSFSSRPSNNKHRAFICLGGTLYLLDNLAPSMSWRQIFGRKCWRPAYYYCYYLFTSFHTNINLWPSLKPEWQQVSSGLQ